MLQRQMWPEMYELLRGSGIMPRRSLREGATLPMGRREMRPKSGLILRSYRLCRS